MRKLTPEKVVIPEKIRERTGVYVLTLLGYTVKTLGKPIPITCKNPKCRMFQWASKTGNSTGVADVLVSHEARWPGVWVMLETKRTGGAKREEQVALVEDGLSTFVTTEEEFVRAIIMAEQRMHLSINPKLSNWLEVNRKASWTPESCQVN